MVFAIGATSLEESGKSGYPSPLSFYIAAMEKGGSSIGLASIEDIQAVLLILIFSIHQDVGSK